MPNRILRPWIDSEAVNSLDNAAEVFFVRLIMVADDFGRFYGSPKLLCSYLYPLRDIRVSDISRQIAACVKAGLIADYEVAGKRYLQIWNFGQRTRQMKSKFPPPPNDGQMTVNCQSNDSQLSVPRRETETETETNNSSDTSVSPEFCLEPEISGSPVTTKPEKIYFDYEGDAQLHGITPEQIAYWQERCPALDVEAELKMAETWLDSNRKNRKSDIKRFLSNWLLRNQDKAHCQNNSKRKPIRDYTGL